MAAIDDLRADFEKLVGLVKVALNSQGIHEHNPVLAELGPQESSPEEGK